MKKKILALALVVGLLAIAVGGTLAWFTDEDSATNVFTIGSVDVEIMEDFASPGAMIPIVDANDPENDENFINKDVRLYNNGDNPAYVQIFVAVPKVLDDSGAFHLLEVNQTDWLKDGTVYSATVNGIQYNVYKYVYNNELLVRKVTLDVITGAYLDPKLDYNGDTDKFVMNGIDIDFDVSENIHVLIAAQAIQSQGFETRDAALSNFTEIPTFD